MNLTYKIDQPVNAFDFTDLLNRSTLGERRPVDDPECMKGMVENTNLMITAWDGDLLVGVSRSVTDFHFACYLSDLAVDKTYQQSGIGKKLMQLTQQQLGSKCMLMLLSAPAANDYYPHVGFTNNPRCWVLDRDSSVQ